METTSNFKHSDTSSSPLNSPPTSSNHNNTANNNGNHHNNNNHNQPSLPITRSDPNSPYPTTFVTADSSSFKQVVQMLTGSSETNSPKPQQQPQHQQHHHQQQQQHHHHHQQQQQQQQQQHETPCSSLSTTKGYVIPPIKTTPKKPTTKLFERRNSIKHLISPLTSAAAAPSSSPFQTTSFSPRYKQEILSPSLLDFPSLTLSPVTPLVEDPFNKSSPSNFSTTNGVGGFGGGRSGPASSSEEEKAIAEKGFFLHPSPNSTPRDSQPQLLPLFPLTSPRISHP